MPKRFEKPSISMSNDFKASTTSTLASSVIKCVAPIQKEIMVVRIATDLNIHVAHCGLGEFKAPNFTVDILRILMFFCGLVSRGQFGVVTKDFICRAVVVIGYLLPIFNF